MTAIPAKQRRGLRVDTSDVSQAALDAIDEILALVVAAHYRRVKRLATAKWVRANRARRRATAKACYERNREKYVAKAAAWREANREKHNAACKRWCDNNPGYKTATRKRLREARA